MPDPSKQDLTQILARAQEIQNNQAQVLNSDPEVESLLSAAEEAGLDRQAVLTALQERLTEQILEHKPGEIVFAESPDGHWYAATFLGQEGNRIQLRYLNGGEGHVEPSQVKFFNLAPGQKIQVFSSSYKMWVDAELTRYNPDSKSISATFWYTEEFFTLERIRIKTQTPLTTFKKLNLRSQVVLASLISGTSGAIIAAIIMALINR